VRRVGFSGKMKARDVWKDRALFPWRDGLMKKTCLVILAALPLLAASCANNLNNPRALSKSVAVTHDFSHETDFSGLKSYQWVPLSETMAEGQYPQDVMASMKIAFTDALKAKGFERVKNAPDFLVALYGVKEGKIQATDWGYNYRWDQNSWGGYWNERRISAREYEEGTMVLDILDPDERELIWSGTAVAVLFAGMSGDKRNQRIDEAVAKLLDQFPPLVK